MPNYSRAGAGHLATLMHRALERGDAAVLAALRAECARRPAADQEACRREWIRQCAVRRRETRWRAGTPKLHVSHTKQTGEGTPAVWLVR